MWTIYLNTFIRSVSNHHIYIYIYTSHWWSGKIELKAAANITTIIFNKITCKWIIVNFICGKNNENAVYRTMTHQNHLTNGASLEDCHTNFFALVRFNMIFTHLYFSIIFFCFLLVFILFLSFYICLISVWNKCRQFQF